MQRIRVNLWNIYNVSKREALVRHASTANKCPVANASKVLFQFVPQSVCVVTPQATASGEGQAGLRGMTCSSFTNISNSPPILGFAVRTESGILKLLENSSHFGVHVLSKKQLHLAVRFALQPRGKDPFQGIKYSLNQHSVPILPDCVGVFECEKHNSHKVGDHQVFYGKVTRCTLNPALQASANGSFDANKLSEYDPLVFFMRQYLTVGDSVFMRAFEEKQLPFEQWTHDAHLRMAFNYLMRYGKERAIPLIRNGIRQFNEVNKAHIRTGYHETITITFVHLLDATVKEWRKSLFASNGNAQDEIVRDALSFEKFLEFAPARALLDKDVLLQYYSEERINSIYARHSFVKPDRKPLPGIEE